MSAHVPVSGPTYSIIREKSSWLLEQTVTMALSSGWQPIGAPFIVKHWSWAFGRQDEWCQAVIKAKQSEGE